MSLVSVGVFSYPDTEIGSQWFGSSSTVSTNSVFELVDGGTTKIAAVFPVPKNGSIDTIGFKTGSVNISSGILASLQAVNISNGTPVGTFLGPNHRATGIQGSIASQTWYELSLSEAAAVHAGDPLAVVLEWSYVAGDSYIVMSNQWMNNSFPYIATYTTSWQAKRQNVPDIAVRYTDGTWAFTGFTTEISALANQTYNSSSSPNEYGNVFVLPFNCRAIGAWAMFLPDINTDYHTINLYNNITLIATCTGYPSIVQSHDFIKNYFFTPVTLSAGNSYYLSLLPNSGTTSNVDLYGVTLPDVSKLSTWPGGSGVYQCSRTGNGAWSTSNTNIMSLGLLLDKVDNGTSAGSGTTGGGFIVGSNPFHSTLIM